MRLGIPWIASTCRIKTNKMKKSTTAAISRGAPALSVDYADMIADHPRSQTSDAADDTTQILKLDLPEAPTVLIVDDDDLVLARLQDLVTAAGYAVRTAATGLEALTLLEESAASIVITDLSMPDMNGLELCRRIREHVWPGYVYVVLLTVKDEEKDILAGLDAGADDYMSKRTSAAQFTARLRTARRVLALEYSLKSALEKKHRIAMTDALTGAYNRRYFTRHLSRETKRAQRFGGKVSLLLLDVDHFKRVNDSYGHGGGDIVLKRLTREIAKYLRRDTDWFARIGGEEFALVLEGTALADAFGRAEKVRRAIENASIETPKGTVRITVSIGISGLEEFTNRNSVTAKALLERADNNLYASKARGRNCITLSDSNKAPMEAQEPQAGSVNDRFLERSKTDVIRLREMIERSRLGGQSVLKELEQLAHSIHGTGAMCDFLLISAAAGVIEGLVKTVIAGAGTPNSTIGLAVLQQLSDGTGHLESEVDAARSLRRVTPVCSSGGG
jgi:two-component system, cell cycle response regulator